MESTSDSETAQIRWCGSGYPPGYQKQAAEIPNITRIHTRIAFGTFVELWRRNLGWSPVKLAEEAGIGTEEILEIERNPQVEPEANAVYKLAQVFRIPSKTLLELAGLIEPRTRHLHEEAVRFAARSESVAALSQQEKEAFEAFVAAIAETARK